ncbi:SDR family NAD(P)-dependent oxidoreductase [Nocardioides dilutus]
MDVTKYGPWAVIAGGSEGVGRSFATQLAEAGLDLVLIARKPVALEETAELCRAYGVRVRPLALDLTAPDAVERVIDEVEDVEVGLLVYNAGANSHSEEFLDGDLAEFQRVIDLNVTTPLALVQHFGRSMRDRGRGGILLVGSKASYVGSVRHTVYGGVKAFRRIFAEGLWLELRDHGVDVLELVLGVTRTPAMERVGLDLEVTGFEAADPDDVAREGLARLAHGPLHRVGDADQKSRADVVLGTHRAMQQLFGGSA